jgi:hypothetical protein
MARHPDRCLDNYLKRRYDVTLDEYHTMLDAQNGVCAICGQPETAVIKGTVCRLAIDHCHVTGRVRGLLCRDCNTVLGKWGDNVKRFLLAADYLEVV